MPMFLPPATFRKEPKLWRMARVLDLPTVNLLSLNIREYWHAHGCDEATVVLEVVRVIDGDTLREFLRIAREGV